MDVKWSDRKQLVFHLNKLLCIFLFFSSKAGYHTACSRFKEHSIPKFHQMRCSPTVIYKYVRCSAAERCERKIGVCADHGASVRGIASKNYASNRLPLSREKLSVKLRLVSDVPRNDRKVLPDGGYPSLTSFPSVTRRRRSSTL